MARRTRRNRSTQDQMLLRIERTAWRFLDPDLVQADREDIVDTIVAACLRKLRAGSWSRPKNFPAFIRRLVNNTVDGRRRRQLRAKAYEAQQSGADDCSSLPEWMTPDGDWSEAEIVAFQAHVAARLPDRCRKAYYMVRVDGSTYAEAAQRLRVSRNTVMNYIVQAQRLFRAELELLGIACRRPGDRPQEPVPGGRSEGTPKPRIQITHVFTSRKGEHARNLTSRIRSLA